MMLMTDIHVRSFTGSGLKPYLHSIAKLRMEVFKDFPYYEDSDLDRETQLLRKIATHKETIGVLIFDNTTLVGVSLGCPLAIEEPAIQKPFTERKMDIESFFYFGDSALLKQYRGRGIGHHFFDARETHVAHFKKYQHICFCVPDDAPLENAKPKDYVPLHDFWRKRGYIHHPHMKCYLFWKKMGNAHPTGHQMSFWIKDLH